jgi:glyceraldehyde-3-phosphate dehydrogenase/erythrose-4-phosphate dehydrogenase
VCAGRDLRPGDLDALHRVGRLVADLERNGDLVTTNNVLILKMVYKFSVGSPDAQSVDPDLDVVTMAVKVPETIAHLHYWSVQMTRAADKAEVENRDQTIRTLQRMISRYL